MKRWLLNLCLVVPALAGDVLTTAEESDYRATSSHAEVIEFCDALAAESPRVVHRTFGQTGEDRALPLLILSEGGIAAPDERLTVLCLGNIHAGEVSGKEALLMLARQLARAQDPGVLKHFNLIIAPIYNADGNEKMAIDNRPGQIGPEHGMGERENAQMLDLNRDFVKVMAPETRALLALLNRWSPAIVIDTHTTNGSLHRYTLTYGLPRHPNTDRRLVDYLREEFLPGVTTSLSDRSPYDTFFYGNFAGKQNERWETYPALPRYGVHYLGFRQSLGILSEAYIYASYRDRVLATRDFVMECLRRSERDREKIATLISEARQMPQVGDPIVLRHRIAAFAEKRIVKGYRKIGPNPTAEEQDLLVEYWGDAEPSLSVPMPYAYLLSDELTEVTAKLQAHGIVVDRLTEDRTLTVLQQQITDQETASQAYEGRHLVTVKTVRTSTGERAFPAGTAIIFTAQPLGKLASFLLEAQAEDGFFTWGLIEAGPEGRSPIFRLEAEPEPNFRSITSD